MLVDQFGRPLQRVPNAQLLERQAVATVGSVRQIETGHPADGLDPRRLTRILREAETGDATAYLELAEQMEEKDLHYSAVLGARKRAIRSLTLQVDPGAKDAASNKAADMTRDVLNSSAIRTTLIDMMDAIGKGYSVCELLWQRDGKSGLKVAGLEWVDPRWFEFDRANGNHLYLRDNAGPQPLRADCYVIHLAKTKSGLPIRGGLARLAAWAYMFKNFTMKDWAIFCEAYGHPLRLGKYDSSATLEDRRTLLRAVRQIGVDMAAIIPKSMEIEIVTAARTGAEKLYEGKARFWDEQVSKGVLGQVATTDAIAGGHAVGKIHEEVRSDIRDADAEQVAATLERDIAAAIVRVNFPPESGAQVPRVSFVSPERADPKLMMELLEKGPKAGLRISVRQVRKVFALEEPEDGEEVLEPPAAAEPPEAPDIPPPAPPAVPGKSDRVAASRAAAAARDSIDQLIDELIAGGGMQKAMEGEIGELLEALARARDINDVQDILDAFRQAAPGAVFDLLSQSTFAARLAGETGVEIRD